MSVRASIPGRSSNTSSPEELGKAVRRVAEGAARVKGLELRGRAHQVSAGPQHASHLGHQRLGPRHVLEHLEAENQIERRVVERDVLAVEGGELGVGSRTRQHLGGVVHVETNPARRGIKAAEEIHGVPVPTAEVEHGRSAHAGHCAGHQVVGQRLAGVGGRNAVAQQLLEVVGDHSCESSSG